MAGSLEAFKLFNSQQRKPRQEARQEPTSDTPAETPTSNTAQQPPETTTPASDASDVAQDQTATEQAVPENGLKVCVANTMAYNRREQNYREVEHRMAELNRG